MDAERTDDQTDDPNIRAIRIVRGGIKTMTDRQESASGVRAV